MDTNTKQFTDREKNIYFYIFRNLFLFKFS